jgi:hypothetical protein
MSSLISFFFSHALFSVLAFIISQVLAAFLPIILTFPFRRWLKGMEGMDIFYGIGASIAWLTYIILLFAHLRSFCEINSINRSFLYYIVIFLSIIAVISTKVSTDSDNPMIVWHEINKWVNYIPPLAFYVLLIFLPVIYDQNIFTAIPTWYIALNRFDLIWLLMLISSLALPIWYVKSCFIIVEDLRGY